MTVSDVPHLYTMREAAEIVGIGYNILLGAAKAGHLIHVKIGSHYRVSLSSLDKFVHDLEEGKVILKTR